MDASFKFVGHLKNLEPWKGAWNQTGTMTVYYKYKSGDFELATNFREGEKNIFKVVKRYYRNNSSNDLSRILCHMSGNIIMSETCL